MTHKMRLSGEATKWVERQLERAGSRGWVVFVVVRKWAWHDSCAYTGWSLYALHSLLGSKEGVPVLSYQLGQMCGGRGQGRGVARKLLAVKHQNWNWTAYYSTILKPCGEVIRGSGGDAEYLIHLQKIAYTGYDLRLPLFCVTQANRGPPSTSASFSHNEAITFKINLHLKIKMETKKFL